MTFSLLLQIFSLELRKAFSYRVDFWVEFLATIAIDLVIAYFLWGAIFALSDSETIGGYTFLGIVFYRLLAQLVFKIVRGNEMGFMSMDIYEGSLNRYLIYPMPYFAYKFIAHLVVGFAGVMQLAIAVGGFILLAGVPAEASLSPASIGMGLISCLAGAYLYFTLAACLETSSFWFDNTWSLLAMLRFVSNLLAGGMIPLALFPDRAREILEVLPFAPMGSLPIRCFMGLATLEEWLLGLAVALVWSVFFSGLWYLIWRRGTLRYTGVGI